jgi:glucan phosphoethanolaminetransferase (alkaline phosphatase superfamily)
MKAASRVLVDILLVGIVWYLSACLIVLLLGYGFNNNPIAADHYEGNAKFVASVCTLIFMLAYSWKIRHYSKAILGISILITIGMLSYYGYQYSLIRSEQQRVLIKYQTFRQALLEEDYQRA